MKSISQIRTPYVRFFARAVKFLTEQLRGVYGQRWRASIDASGSGGWRITFVHWDAAGLESKESFSVSDEHD